MKTNSGYQEIIVKMKQETGITKTVFWSFQSAMKFITDNAPALGSRETVFEMYGREPVKYNKKDFPELYE